ncbi:uncharacterized protein TNCV_476501 [Trichonephila clavipes]|nr:uncharacterized protein TNCV_476501 [Trichonephila clavipes]
MPVKHQICNISGDHPKPKIITRLRTGHHRRMKFNRDGRRTYRSCDNCIDTELTPAYIFDCPAILAVLQEMGFCFRQQTPITLNRLPEQSSGPTVLSDLVLSWIRHFHHHYL